MKIQIVDPDDNLIGSISWEELDLAHDIYRVSALWLTNSGGQVLLAQRSLNNDNGAGEWGPAVAGTVDEGETYQTNIYKEAEEEIGLAGVNFEKGPKHKVDGARNYFCQWFRATVDKEINSFTLQADEVEAIKWIDASQLILDVHKNPEKYINGMAEIIKMLAK